MFEQFLAKEKSSRVVASVFFILFGILCFGICMANRNEADDEIFGLIVFTVISITFVVIGIAVLVRGVKGSPIDTMMKYCERTGNAAFAKAEIEQFIAMTPEVCGVRASDKYIIMTNRGKLTMFLSTPTVIWIYQQVTKHYYGLIPTGKTYAIFFCLTDGTRTSCQMQNKKISAGAIEKIYAEVPYLLYGSSKEISAAYINNRVGLMNEVIARRNEIIRNRISQ